MTADSDPAAALHRRLDRLDVGLNLARSLAVLGSSAASLAISIVAIAFVDRTFFTIPAVWGGGGGLLAALGAGWLVGRQLAFTNVAQSRLAICQRLERAAPDVGERLSRAIGLPAAPHQAGQAADVQRQLQAAARTDAAHALDSLAVGRWFRRQPEVRAATLSLAVATLSWAGLAWSVTHGQAGWQDAIARQFRDTPAAGSPEPAGRVPPLPAPSVPEATLQVYQHIVDLRSHWRQPLVTTTDAASQLTQAADRAQQLTEACLADSPDASAVILRHLASGLGQTARAAVGASSEEVLEKLERLLDVAEAAAGLAEAADAVLTAEKLLTREAAKSVGLTTADLDPASHAWRSSIASGLRAVATGMTVEQSLLAREAVLASDDLSWLPTATLTAALLENRLFAACACLGEARRSLASMTATLGMPPLAAEASRSLTAAHRQLVMLETAAAATAPPPLASQSAANATPPDHDREPPAAASATTPGEPGAAPSTADATSTAAATGPTNASVAPDATPTDSPPRTIAEGQGNVWIPQPIAPQQPAVRLEPSERDPAATPGYFRRLRDQAATADWWHAVADLPAVMAMAVLTAVADATEERREAPPAAAQASAAVERGLVWLVAAQQPDGSWGSQRFRGSVAVTAHGLLALASTGSTAVAGPHANASERAVGFLLAQAASDGLIAGNEASAHGPMYGHAFAVQALAELSGESDRPEITATLRRACRLIEQTQNDAGGWRYQPRRADADLSVTAAMVVALEAASASGLDVSEQTIERAVAYLLRLQNPDGGFRYHATGGPSGAARTAAALVALGLTSPASTEALTAGRGWLRSHPLSPDPSDGYAAYGVLASSTAAWQEGPAAWSQWYAATAEDLLSAQRSDGSWPDPSCPEYGTAAAVLSLTTANGLLPGWKRGRQP